MPRAMNKHGFIGIRKRTDGRAKPYYARLTVKGEYVYLNSHETPDEAAKEFQKYRSLLEPRRRMNIAKTGALT